MIGLLFSATESYSAHAMADKHRAPSAVPLAINIQLELMPGCFILAPDIGGWINNNARALAPSVISQGLFT